MVFSISCLTPAMVLCIVLSIISRSSGDKGCSFKHNGCNYNIYLNHKDDIPEQDCGTRAQAVFLERAQNDYNAKIDDMEKNFSFLKDAHEQRIRELETSVKELLGVDLIDARQKPLDRSRVEISKTPSLNLFNDRTMNIVQEEINKLRDEVYQKSNELMDTRDKLNETSTLMHEVQLQHFKSSQELVDAQNQITLLKRERAILKNQLKDRSYRMGVTEKKAEECEQKSTEQQDKILELFRSESTLKEVLMTTELKLNISQEEYVKAERKHSSLRTKHEQLKEYVKIREQELMDCYMAKTNTFCGFEDPDWCGFHNINDTSDFFNWERVQGRTPSAGTGPSHDHTCHGPNGHFMYIEASAKGRGNNAILYSPLYRGLVAQCVEFFYHMHGRDIGTLNVYAKPRGQVLQSAWRAYGNQGDVWTGARLAIPKELAMVGYQLAFEGIAENGFQGDIAIDDIRVTDGPCPVDAMITPVKIPTNSTTTVKKERSALRKLRRKIKKRMRKTT